MELLTTLPPSTAEAGEYKVLLDALNARFGDRHLQILRPSELRHRQQHLGESLQVLSADVERLAQKAFRGNPSGILDAVGASVFLDAIGDTNIQRWGRMSRHTTVRLALATALEVQATEVSLYASQRDVTSPADTDSAPSSSHRRRRAVRCFNCGCPGHIDRECQSYSQRNSTPGPLGEED